MSENQMFLYGPFADELLLSTLLGVSFKATQSATLAGFGLREHALSGAAALVVQENSKVPGVIVSGVSDAARATLEFYLKVHGNLFKPVLICSDGQEGPATAPFSDPASDDPWEAQNWLETWGPIWRESVDEVVSLQSKLSPEDVTRRLPVIWVRAAARLAVRQEPRFADSGLTLQDITLHDCRRAYSNFFAVDELELSHKQFDGSHGQVLHREVFVAADAATVLPYDPKRDVVLLVEQVRMGPLARGDLSPWVMEPIAGRIEPGDSPETTVHKEAMEEAGLALNNLHHIASYYPSPGCVTEFIHSYLGIADLPETAAKLGGVDAEGEDIRGHILSRAALMQRITEGTLPNGPLVLSAFWLQANLAQIRGLC